MSRFTDWLQDVRAARAQQQIEAGEHYLNSIGIVDTERVTRVLPKPDTEPTTREEIKRLHTFGHIDTREAQRLYGIADRRAEDRGDTLPEPSDPADKVRPWTVTNADGKTMRRFETESEAKRYRRACCDWLPRQEVAGYTISQDSF